MSSDDAASSSSSDNGKLDSADSSSSSESSSCSEASEKASSVQEKSASVEEATEERACPENTDSESSSKASSVPERHGALKGTKEEHARPSDTDSEQQSGSEALSRQGCSDDAGSSSSSDNAKSGSSDSSSSGSSSSSSKASSVAEKSAFVKETTEEHARRHDYPANLKTCARCQYIHNRTKWESLAVYEHPVTGEKLTYLMEQPSVSMPWGLGCSLCRAAGFKNQYALCRAKGRLCNILRHGNVLPDQLAGSQKLTSDHARALQMWQQKQQGRVSESVEEEAERVAKGPPGTAITYCHVLFNRTLIETGGSFRDFRKWAETARLSGAALPAGADDRRISAQLTDCMAQEERHVTSKLLRAASAAAFKQDGRGQHVMNTLHLVLWSWPRGLNRTQSGVECFGQEDAGPWLVSRVAALSSLKSDHSAAAKCAAAEEAIASNCPSSDAFAHAQQVLRHYISDNANDAVQTGQLLQRKFGQLQFMAQGAMHSAALVLKTTLASDPEIELVEQLLVSRKKPPSLARLLTQSERFRAEFGERQREAGVKALTHLGWRPARVDSKKKPLGRFALRLQQCFEILAWEAEDSKDVNRRDAASNLLQELSGENTARLVLAGMIADLAHEHAIWTRAFDVQNPEPLSVKMATQTFLQRLKLLFTDGLILTKAADETFTGEVLKFLAQASHKGHLFQV